MLHLLAFPGARTDLLTLLQHCLAEGDDVVLLDEGLQWLTNEQVLLQLTATGARLHALGGQSDKSCATDIDYPGLIALSEQHPASSSWYP